MTPHHIVAGEISCYLNCVTNSPFAWLITLLMCGAVLLFLAYLFISTPIHRIKIFVAGQCLIIAAVLLSFSTMVCNSMLSIDVYMIYTLLTLGVMFAIPRIYERLLVKRLNAVPINDLLEWPWKFVNQFVTGAKVFYFDSSIPRAFASGRSIFLSIGLLELLSDEELKAVLAHESWHLMHKNKTHWLKQLSIMTFMPLVRSDLERMADQFAMDIVGSESLEQARSKLFSTFIPD